MTYVVVELCVDCKYTDCAAVCPVEAFHELPDSVFTLMRILVLIVTRACLNVRLKLSSPIRTFLKTTHIGLK